MLILVIVQLYKPAEFTAILLFVVDEIMPVPDHEYVTDVDDVNDTETATVGDPHVILPEDMIDALGEVVLETTVIEPEELQPLLVLVNTKL